MKLPSSTQTIRETLPLFIYGMFEKEGILPTKSIIYRMFKSKQENEPYLFGKSCWESTYGTIRSWLSEVCKEKENKKLKDIKSFNFQGVDYFFTDIEQVYKLAAVGNNIIQVSDSYSPKIREHCNIQYELCHIFSKIGYKFWVPNQDSSGSNGVTKYGDRTISEVFSEKLVSLTTKNELYWVDFVVFDRDKPIIQLEVEQSTKVLAGMERMMQSKQAFKKIKSYVTSTNNNYIDIFNKFSDGTYKDLGATFLNRKKIESLYKKSISENIDIETFRSVVKKEFSL